MKTLNLKKMGVPKIAVLATGLTAAVLVGTISPQAAQATPDEAAACTGCHSAGGSVAATPSSTTVASGAAYTVALAFTGGTSPNGFWISGNGANVTGTSATSAPMTAPTAAGNYTYTVWVRSGVVATTTYTITVGAVATTPPVTTTTAPPVTTTTEPPVTTTTEPPVTTTTEPPVTTTTEPPVTTTPQPATTKPLAPLNVAAEAGDGDALVYWDDAADAGPGTVYTVTSTPGGFTATTEGIGAIVTGLTNDTSYTFTVTATTKNGTSVASSVSNAVTPAADATTRPVPTATTPVVAGASAVIPVGAPNTGAGGMSGSTDAPMAGAGGLALLLAGAGATLVARRRRQV